MKKTFAAFVAVATIAGSLDRNASQAHSVASLQAWQPA